MRARGRCLVALPLLLLWAPVVGAQASNQNPIPSSLLAIDAGRAFRFGDCEDHGEWFRISYQGRQIREHGTPFKYARALDLLAPEPETAGGDVPAIGFRYEGGQGSVAGGLLEALGARELPLAGLKSLRLRGTARLASDADLERITAAVGLESPPLRLPGLAGSGVSNWMVIGLNAEHRGEAEDGAESGEYLLGTARAFAGKAFGWRKSADVGSTAGKLVKDLLELAPTRAAALVLRDTLLAIPANRRTTVQQQVLDAIPEARSDAEWEQTIHELAFGAADAITDQPTVAVYVEGSGWLDLLGDTEARHPVGLVTATLDYWFWPSRDDVLLRIRYEHGYERSALSLKKDHVLVVIGLRF